MRPMAKRKRAMPAVMLNAIARQAYRRERRQGNTGYGQAVAGEAEVAAQAAGARGRRNIGGRHAARGAGREAFARRRMAR